MQRRCKDVTRYKLEVEVEVQTDAAGHERGALLRLGVTEVNKPMVECNQMKGKKP